jgi:hypothetical protein
MFGNSWGPATMLTGSHGRGSNVGVALPTLTQEHICIRGALEVQFGILVVWILIVIASLTRPIGIDIYLHILQPLLAPHPDQCLLIRPLHLMPIDLDFRLIQYPRLRLSGRSRGLLQSVGNGIQITDVRKIVKFDIGWAAT